MKTVISGISEEIVRFNKNGRKGHTFYNYRRQSLGRQYADAVGG